MTSQKGPIGARLLLATSLLATTLGCAQTKVSTSGAETPPQAQVEAPAQADVTSTDIVLDAVAALFIDFDAPKATALLAEDYIQHNPGVPTGAAPVIGFIPGLEQSGIKVTTHRVLSEGDVVVLHSTYENAQAFGADTLVAFDVFRVEDGKVAEHWDNLQSPPETTASGNSMTDGSTKVLDKGKTSANKAVVESFIEDVLLGGQFDKAPDYVVADPGAYIQHNPGVGNGLDGLGEAVAYLASQGQAMAYSKVHRVVADGNFVFVMSEGTLGDAPMAFFDLFRLESGMIVEHWDVIAGIPPESEMAHTNGKF